MLHEASGEMRKLKVGRRTAEVEGRRVFDTSRVVLHGKKVGRHAGVRVMPVVRGHGREQGGVKLHFQCGAHFGWIA